MCGLKQAAILAYEQLMKHLAQHVYEPVVGTMCIFNHKTRKTQFCLCVDDFGVKYNTQGDLQHFLKALRSKYKITTDLQGEHFCGLTFKWNYADGYVHMAMPGYVEKALSRLQHKPQQVPQHSPHEFTPILRQEQGSQQFAKEDTSPFVNKEQTKWVQLVVGSFLYYG